MNRFRLIAWVLIGILLVSGCTRKFRLKRDEIIPESSWQYARGDAAATAVSETGFSGVLNVKWEDRISEAPIGPLTIGAGRLIIPGSRGRIYFYEPSTGKFRGRHKERSGAQTGLVVVDSLAYFSVAPPKDYFVCFNLHTRESLWKVRLKDVSGTPIIVENNVYVASSLGSVYCYNRLTGAMIWRDSVGGNSLGGPSFSEGTVYFPFDDGWVYGFDAGNGKRIIAVNLQQPLVSKVVVNDRVYVTAIEGGVYAVEKNDGSTVWSRQFDRSIWTAPAVDDRCLYFGDSDGVLHALDKRDGTTVWEFKTEGVILSSPILVGDKVVFASLDRHVYCLDKADGRMISRRFFKHEIRFPAVTDGTNVFVVLQNGSVQCLGE
ncbi:MAG: PQQ-binding-like beta-propeller repeat protein [candidate division Zixibacteria bacterium]|nr:PQQ-binding-like beta-propeller repeat protein [candidate division Zixibacteria bacterium]